MNVSAIMIKICGHIILKWVFQHAKFFSNLVFSVYLKHIYYRKDEITGYYLHVHTLTSAIKKSFLHSFTFFLGECWLEKGWYNSKLWHLLQYMNNFLGSNSSGGEQFDSWLPWATCWIFLGPDIEPHVASGVWMSDKEKDSFNITNK